MKSVQFSSLSRVQLFAAPWTAALQASQSISQFFTSGSQSTGVSASALVLPINIQDCSLPGSSVHGIFQARILEWVAISFFRGSS